MNEQQFEHIMSEMADFTAETLSREEAHKRKLELRETLIKFKNMLKGSEFRRKCKAQAKQYGVPESMVRNVYARNLLDKIGGTAGVMIEVVGEVFNYLVRLVSYVIQKIMDIAVSALTTLVNIVTFRKPIEG